MMSHIAQAQVLSGHDPSVVAYAVSGVEVVNTT